MEKERNNGDEGAALDLLMDEVGVLGAKAMGVYGAMKRGIPKDEALKKYGLTQADYEIGCRQAGLNE